MAVSYMPRSAVVALQNKSLASSAFDVVTDVMGNASVRSALKTTSSTIGAISKSPLVRSTAVGLVVGTGLTLVAQAVINYALAKTAPTSAVPNAVANKAPASVVDASRTSSSDLARSSISRAKKASIAIAPSGVSLLDILERSGENTFQVLSAQAQVLAEQLGLSNEQFGIHLAFMEGISSSLASVAESMAIQASLALDMANAKADSSVKEESFLDGMVALASSVLVVSDHAQTERAIHDLDGTVVAVASPMAMTAAKDATTARTRTDQNSEEYNDIDLPLLDLLPIIPFAGVSSSFDKSVNISVNPFTHKNI
jgi:hypothetical protein